MTRAKLTAQAVGDYYAADAQAKKWAAQTEKELAALRGPDYAARVAERYALSGAGTIEARFPVDAARTLVAALDPGDGTRPPVIAVWAVESAGDYEIDDSLPVWTGEDMG
jgi:hypothetical protein